MKLKKKSWIRYFFRIVLLVLLIVGSYFVYRNYRILKQVHQYDTQVQAAVEAQGIPEYKDLVLSIIFTETKGLGDDPMQSSESAHGQPNQITESDRSIEQGVSYLSEAIEKSEEADTDLWTAVQAYNFGLEYIDYVADNGGKNTLELAENYSRDVLSPLLGNDNQTMYRYIGVHSFIYNGGYLYHNGGNLYYAELVKLNEQKIKWTNFLFE